MMKGFFLPKALDTTANEDYCVDYKKGYISTEPHWHDCSEIIYNIKGNATVFFVNKRYELKEKEMIFVPWGTFTPQHIATLLLSAALIVGLHFLLRKLPQKQQTAILFVLSFAGIAAIVFNLLM